MEPNKYIVITGEANNSDEAIKLCGKALQEEGVVGKQFATLCIEREKEYPTGLPTEIPTAIPHASDETITANCICFLKLKNPVAFKRMDDDSQVVNTDMIFNLAIKDPKEHLKALQNMMIFLNDVDSLKKCRILEGKALIDYLVENIG